MNFLAHIYLSFDDKEITLGNFFADHIRGNKFKHLPDRIQKGILLHREIDTFTDSHPTVRQSSKRLHKNYSHYSRVIVDIYYDHFLAKNWSDYSDTPLEDYVEDFYDLLEDNYDIILEEHYTDFEKEFTSFFKELITFSNQKFISLCED